MYGDGTRAGERDMTENLQAAPDSWIGEEIVLRYTGGPQTHRHECTLRAVNDRGVVVEHKGATVFHPWNSVNAIQHGKLEQAAPVSFPSRGS
jgi:hypothetical protein